jgi:hypothetical protein
MEQTASFGALFDLLIALEELKEMARRHEVAPESPS